MWRRKSSGGEAPPAGASSCRDDEVYKVPRGHVPMVAGCGDDGERVLVPVWLLGDPRIAQLLDMAVQQYGYGQPGVLRVPCDDEHLRRVVECVLRNGGGHSQA